MWFVVCDLIATAENPSLADLERVEVQTAMDVSSDGNLADLNENIASSTSSHYRKGSLGGLQEELVP